MALLIAYLYLLFIDLANFILLDRLATFVEPVSVAGDLNVRLDRVDDLAAIQHVDVLADHGLSNRVTMQTHKLGGILDVVATRDDLPVPSVKVVDVSLSDHRLLQWPVPTSRPPPVYRSVDVRQWRLLDHSDFHTALASSSLCNPDVWSDHDADDMALVYDREITSILDRMIPVRTVTCRQRPSDPYFDDECRAAKRRAHRLERTSCRAHKWVTAAVVLTQDLVAAASAADAAWRAERRSYRDLCNQKRERNFVLSFQVFRYLSPLHCFQIITYNHCQVFFIRDTFQFHIIHNILSLDIIVSHVYNLTFLNIEKHLPFFRPCNKATQFAHTNRLLIHGRT